MGLDTYLKCALLLLLKKKAQIDVTALSSVSYSDITNWIRNNRWPYFSELNPSRLFFETIITTSLHSVGPHLVVVPPLRLVLGAHLADQLLDFGSPQRILRRHRAGITGSVHLLRRVVVRYLVGAVRSPSRRCLRIKPWCFVIKWQLKPQLFFIFTYNTTQNDTKKWSQQPH